MEELNLKIERYEGPLDLLLALIAKNKLNIFDIPIAEIAEQYMAHIEAMRSLNMEVTSEFIYYAAELMLIKSRMLLPREEEEDPRRNLVDALLEYRRARAAAELLRERGELYYDRFTKAPDEIEAAYERPHAVSLLAEAFERIRARLADKPEQGEVELFAKIGQERYYTVEEKSVAVLRRLCRRGQHAVSGDVRRLPQPRRGRGRVPRRARAGALRTRGRGKNREGRIAFDSQPGQKGARRA